MRKLLRIFVLAALVLAVSGLSPAIAQEEAINPGSLEKGVSTLAFIPPTQPGSILLLDGLDHNGHRALDIFGYTYTEVAAAGLAGETLGDYDIIFVAWYPSQAMVDALNAKAADLESWISGGGGIVVNAQFDVSGPYSFLPVTFTADSGNHTQGVHIVAPTHPLADGLTDALLSNWGNSTHGKITSIPAGATVVTIATSTGSPHVIEMCYGGGKIVVAASDPEFHVVYGPGDGPRILLSNELCWAAIPCNTPPVADCQGAVVAVGQVPDIDGGSYDPDGDPIVVDLPEAFTEAGIYYDVMLTVTDPSGATDSCTATVVVYDPSAGFVTGGGWINSPSGAYKPDGTLVGKANFGFVSKYKKGASVPDGQTEFMFQTANLNFHSSSYEWLVVTGSDYAKFKGMGTINGFGAYKFQIWARDGAPDKFRIKIWTEDALGVETVEYDNGIEQPIGGGSIIVHTSKK